MCVRDSIYTGDGKGKTTAAVGLCTRAAGHGKKAAFYEFLKGAKTGEAKKMCIRDSLCAARGGCIIYNWEEGGENRRRK